MSHCGTHLSHIQAMCVTPRSPHLYGTELVDLTAELQVCVRRRGLGFPVQIALILIPRVRYWAREGKPMLEPFSRFRLLVDLR